ncbi:MAG: hypothetical protein ACJAS3_000282 [Roseivirga sp.]|jgi:hypothetical protein
MYSIVYHSTGSPDLTAKDISSILETSREYNKINGITGCLIYHNHRFIQALEGDRTILEELYLCVKKDKRHSDVKTLYQDIIAERKFNVWNMAFIDFTPDHDNIKERELFETNFIAYCKLVEKSDDASAVFWKEVKLLLNQTTHNKT